MSRLDIVGIGYPSLDNIIRINGQLESGKTSIIVNDNSKDIFFGGCAVNMCSLLSFFHHSCGLVMSVGEDFHSSGFYRFLVDKQIDLSLVKECTGVKTSYTTLITDEAGNHCTLFYPGAMEHAHNTNYSLESLDCQYGLITIGELSANQHFMKECIKKGISIVFSMKGDFSVLTKDYLESVFTYSELIFMNQQEFDGLALYMNKSLMTYLEGEYLKALVVTNGENGSVVYSKEETVQIPAYTVETVRDTAGGGDAYIAGFLHERMLGHSFGECGAGGSSLSSFIIEQYGCLSNIPTFEQYEERKNKVLEMM